MTNLLIFKECCLPYAEIFHENEMTVCQILWLAICNQVKYEDLKRLKFTLKIEKDMI